MLSLVEIVTSPFAGFFSCGQVVIPESGETTVYCWLVGHCTLASFLPSITFIEMDCDSPLESGMTQWYTPVGGESGD